MPRVLTLLATLSAISSNGYGNVGVYFGSGHSPQLVTSAHVRMLSEQVTITPICGNSPTTHSVHFRCKFVLQNLSNDSTEVQVGFPLDRDARLIPSDEADLVFSTHFIARDASTTYHLKHVSSDNGGKPRHIFLWDMRFKPGEAKCLQVGYVLPMSVAATSTRKMDMGNVTSLPPHYDKPWHPRIEACMVLSFSYVTETGQSWAGPIGTATFEVRNTTFEHSMRRLFQCQSCPDEEAANRRVDDSDLMVGGKLATIWSVVSPPHSSPSYPEQRLLDLSKAQHQSDEIHWRFENYNPGAPLIVRYYLLGFPFTPADCDPWVGSVLGESRSKADLQELREVVAAFFGVVPQSTSVKRFVEQQIWYSSERRVCEDDLPEQQRAILARLATLTGD